MKYRDILTMSARSIRRGGSRSYLSILGIVIGIASVILILSISQAGQRFIINQVTSFGSDLIFVENGSPEEIEEFTSQLFPKQVLSEKDYAALKNKEWMRLITPMIIQQDTVNFAGETMNMETVGTSEDELAMYDAELQSGAFFTREDVDSRRRVVVIGSDIATRLFGYEEAANKSIELNGQRFRVLGVLERTGTRFLRDVDKQAFVPFTTAMDIYGLDHMMAMVFKTDLPVDRASDQIRVTLREMHNIDDPKDDDFRVYTAEDTAEITRQMTVALQIFLVIVAAISLVVGGIGIMNIMYVSVTERTKEIGVMKAVGAQTGIVLKQFLAESLMLTLIGGLIGTLFGIGLTWLAVKIILIYQEGWSFEISRMGIILGIGFSTAIGVIFGYAPAKKAASMNPIEALRYE
jgi:putative ABC transport system permease protein